MRGEIGEEEFWRGRGAEAHGLDDGGVLPAISGIGRGRHGACGGGGGEADDEVLLERLRRAGRVQREPLLLAHGDHLRAEVEEGQAVDFTAGVQRVVAQVPAGAAGDFEDVAFALLREAFADAVDAHQGFGRAHFAVEAIGRFVVAGGDVGLLVEVLDVGVVAGPAGDDGDLGDVEAETDGEEAQDDGGEFPSGFGFWVVAWLHWLDGQLS